MIKHAGTKDKRGNTTQMVSIRKLDANNVAKLSLRNIWIGNYIYKDSSLKLGSLKGNRFRIILRYFIIYKQFTIIYIFISVVIIIVMYCKFKLYNIY